MPKGMIKPNPDRLPGDLVIYGLIPTDLPSLREIGMAGGVGKAVLGPYRIPNGNDLSSISWYYDQCAIAVNGRRDRF